MESINTKKKPEILTNRACGLAGSTGTVAWLAYRGPIARSRMLTLLDDRLATTPTKKSSFVWGFVADNIANCAAIVTLLDLAAELSELKFLKTEDSLFTNDASKFVEVETGPLSLREESYIVVKTKKNPKVIRAGKVVGGRLQQTLRNYFVLWNEH